MENTIGSKNYELAFHIDPDLEETDARKRFQELAEFINSSTGAAIRNKEPKRIRLSYPIRKKRASYFGFFNFSASPETIEKISTQLKSHNDIIRYLLTGFPADLKNLHTLGERRYRPRIESQEEKKGTAAHPKEKAAESSEQLEQEIEKVIENL